MNKYLSVLLIAVAFTGLAAGQALDDFQYEPEDGFERDIAGGEAFNQEVNFSNSVDRPVPFSVRTVVEASDSEFTDEGLEFTVSGEVTSEAVDVLRLLEEMWSQEELYALNISKDDRPDTVFLRDSQDLRKAYHSEILSVDNASFEELNVSDTAFEEYRPDALIDDVEDERNVFMAVEEDYFEEYLDDELSNQMIPDFFAIPVEASITSEFSTEFTRSDNFTGVYSSDFRPPHLGYVAEGESSVSVDVEASPAIVSDDFRFEFDARSVPGLLSETVETETEDGEASVEAGSVEVDIQAEKDTNVSVQSFEQLTAPEPEDEVFIGGTSVEVEDDVEASGTVSVSYDPEFVEDNELDEESLDVKFFNESQGEWTEEGVETVSVDTGENVVEASVTHFSTYAAFAQHEEDDDSTAGTGGPILIGEEEDESEVEESEEDETEGEASEEESSESDTQQQGDDAEQDQESEGHDEREDEEGEQTGEVEGPEGVTGMFADQPSGLAGAAVLLLVLAAVIYRYREVIVSRVENWR